MPKRKAYPLRIDPAVYDALREWADHELRSVNGQIEFVLVRALREVGRWPRRNDDAAPPGEAPDTDDA